MYIVYFHCIQSDRAWGKLAPAQQEKEFLQRNNTMENEETALSVMHCFPITPRGCTRLIVWVCLPHVKISQQTAEQENTATVLLFLLFFLKSKSWRRALHV